MVQNKAVVFKKIPEGWPVEGEHLVVESREFDTSAAPPAGGVTTRNLYFSLDPYLRGKMRDPKVRSYTPAFELGKPIQSIGLGRVLRSDSPDFAPGDFVLGSFDVAEYSTMAGKQLAPSAPWALRASKLPASIVEDDPRVDVRHYLGALGMSGLTAYSSLLAIAEPKRGETLFVSSAAGSVGQMVGQIAKGLGLRVIGSAGSDDKVRMITEKLGLDAAFDYKKEKSKDALLRLAPDGIDIYYDNVGGEQLEAALGALKDFGRVVECGMISQYNLKPEDRYPLRDLTGIVSKRLKIQGFIVSDPDFADKYEAEHRRVVSQWIRDGTFEPVVDQTDGIENGVKALIAMFRGDNFGKALLKVADVDAGRSSHGTPGGALKGSL